jgi:hypothetical protein
MIRARASLLCAAAPYTIRARYPTHDSNQRERYASSPDDDDDDDGGGGVPTTSNTETDGGDGDEEKVSSRGWAPWT